MHRRPSPPRPDWRQRVEALSFDFHTIDNAPYWDESAFWHFTSAEIDHLEAVGEELHQYCLKAVDYAVSRQRLPLLGITGLAADLVTASWRRGDPALYGRFDIAWTGDGEPKLLEYNADTPTALFESSVVQWQWLTDVAPGADQFNSLHEGLVERWQDLAALPGGQDAVHFTAATPHAEDEGTVRYLQATALEAGLGTSFLDIAEIGWNGGQFVDLDMRPIRRLFKLYPWEWLASEAFAEHLRAAAPQMLEPAWKLVLSSKGLLPLLWQLFPYHPNLLPAAFQPQALGGGRMVRKPLFSREGANIAILDGERVDLSTDGPYGAEGMVWQAWTPLADAGNGTSAVLGLWMIGDRCRGLGLREDDGPITRDSSRFVPHLFT